MAIGVRAVSRLVRCDMSRLVHDPRVRCGRWRCPGLRLAVPDLCSTRPPRRRPPLFPRIYTIRQMTIISRAATAVNSGEP